MVGFQLDNAIDISIPINFGWYLHPFFSPNIVVYLMSHINSASYNTDLKYKFIIIFLVSALLRYP